jgi:hypothetical protein
MAIDPVCQMKVDESKPAATSEYQGKTITSALWAARRLLTRTRKNI